VILAPEEKNGYKQYEDATYTSTKFCQVKKKKNNLRLNNSPASWKATSVWIQSCCTVIETSSPFFTLKEYPS
jgi:hypothetical protein